MEMVCDGRGRFGVRVLGKILYGFLVYIFYWHNVVGGVVYFMNVIYGGAT